MEVTITDTIPSEYTKTAGKTYETQYLYTGFGRINVYERTLEVFQKHEDKTTFFSRPYDPKVVSRVYHTELVRITLYSESPRVWAEELDGKVFFIQAAVSSTLRKGQ
jgi:hypothetical protein